MQNHVTEHATPFSELNLVLQELVTRIMTALDRDFVAAHLQGSFAVGDFDLHSDVDFVITTDRRLTDHQISRLQTIHNYIYHQDSEWAKHLEGSYFPKNILRDYTQAGSQLWYLEHGKHFLVKSSHCNTVIVRWVVREKGLTLAGPPPSTLVDPVPVEALRHDIFTTMNEWGQEILSNPEMIGNRFYQTFAVLSYCRMLHDFHEGAIGSKRAGAEWAKAVLNPLWTDLIDRAWDGRPNPALSVQQPADQQDVAYTLDFIKVVLECCT